MKDVTKTTGTEVATKQVTLDEWGDSGVDITPDDLVIPKMLVMQASSKLVAAQMAAFGEIRNSVTSDLLAKPDESVEFIPFKLEKKWVVEVKLPNGKYKYKHTEPMTAENMAAPQDFKVDGEDYRRIYNMHFYCLTPNQIVDADSAPIPYVIVFKMTSLRAGKILATQMFVENKGMKKSPAAKVCALSAVKKQNDDGTFMVFQTKVARDSKPHEERACLNVFKSMKEMDYTVDTSDEDTVPFNDQF